VRTHPQHRPAFGINYVVPVWPMVVLCVLLISTGLVLYLSDDAADMAGSPANGPETISFAPPSFVFDGGQLDQIHFSTNPRW